MAAAKKDSRNEQQIANDDQLAKVSDLTDEAVVAKVDDVEYVTVKAPFDGATTSVPKGLVDVLLESGYKKSK